MKGSVRKERSLFPWHTLCVTALMQSMLSSCVESVTVSPIFSSVYQLNNLALNNWTGDIYMGAVNRLYQFNEKLNSRIEVETGPQLDNKECYSNYRNSTCVDGKSATLTATSTDNQNQILAVDIQHDQLVVCGTVFHGACNIWNLSNISTTYDQQKASEYSCVGSDDPNVPMIGIIAPGPLGEDVLYVGTASTARTNQDYLLTKCWSGICSLKVNGSGLFSVASFPPNAQVLSVNLKVDIGVGYRLVHVASFSMKGYTYFLTRQQENTLISKISQVCQRDQWYDSYAETQILCPDYGLVQAGVFSQPGVLLADKLGMSIDDYVFFGSFATSSKSNVCFFQLKDIRQKFTENIQQCYNGMPLAFLNFYGGPKPCMKNTQVNITDSFCGTAQRLNSPLNGTIPLIGTPLNLSVTGNITALQSTTVNNYTVLFLGMNNGQLLKFAAGNGSFYQYETVLFESDNTPVNQDLLFNKDMTHIYVMTSYKLYKVPLFECDKRVTCGACLSAGDPFCGWCTLEGRCSTRMECQNSRSPGRWILSIGINRTEDCPAILSVYPAQTDVNFKAQITLSFYGLPPPERDEYFRCLFGSADVSSNATYTSNQLTCPTPSNYMISAGDLSIDLTVQISSEAVGFAKTSFIFYNCNFFSRCSACAEAPWRCHWCIDASQCQHQAITCRFAVDTNLSEKCPRILPEGQEILYASGTLQQLLIPVSNLQSLVTAGADRFQCRLKFEPQPQILQASKLNDTHVICNKSQLYWNLKDPITVALEILWGSNLFNVEGNETVSVYNCSAMAEGDCSICLSLQDDSRAKYGCLWCNNLCQPNNVDSSCRTPDLTCPAFNISNIFPGRVPMDGDSLVTITGTNLGYNFAKVNVEVNGANCSGIENQYVTSRQYVFITSRVSQPGKAVVKITVTSGDGQKTSVSKDIVFTNPTLSDVTPRIGPEAGGTLVTISGNDLQSGSNIQVLLGRTSCIYDMRSNDTHILCRTSRKTDEAPDSNDTTPGFSPRSLSLTSDDGILVKFDNAERRLNANFQFTRDPVINQTLSPGGSFQSGGCIITVSGSNLDSSLSCNVTIDSKVIDCISRNSTHLLFVSPKFEVNVASVLVSRLSIQLDAVTLNTAFNIYADPFLEKVSDAYSVGSTLHIKGSRLFTPCMDRDVIVKVGRQICPITGHTEEALYCTVPALASGETPDVTVLVGQYLVYDLGSLNPPANQLPWAIAIGVIGGVSLVVIFIVVIVFVIKRVESRRRIKKLTQQLELLERNVRSECRLAFTELQTEVSDFNTDLEIIGIPFWDYKTYAFRLLFPKVRNHPVLTVSRNSKNKFGGFDEQMHQFNQLLSSKFFILTFIHVLDRQLKAFSVNDRAKVSSLLSVILLNRMEFATDIVKELLDELINRSIEKKSPKIMLRSTESLVEKLLANWLSLSMYEYLRDNRAGHALFMLHKAMKHQMEKAPIDAVTAEAKNTLSEDRLLREKAEASTLNLTICEANNSTTCKMLTSDTISQAKEKALDALYKNIPYSKRPSVYDVHLAWKTGTETVLALSDEDSTSLVVDGWKRINTLEHYRIPDEATFVLSQKTAYEEESMEAVTEYMSQNFGCSIKSATQNHKIWHLVKHEDSQNAKTGKVISEIFLTRLLSTKMILDKYIQDLFEAIFRVDSSLPRVVKYLYDFLDKSAQIRGISDDDVVHSWKSNSLLLRFWVNVITNPGFVFDINKSDVVGSCLAVVAQAFMDSCSAQELHLGKDSPSTKLLFAKDIPKYRKLVQQFFTAIRNLPPVSDAEMESEMIEMSTRNRTDFNLEMALRDLYFYADKFQYELMVALANNPSAKRMHLLEKFQDIQKSTQNINVPD